jgi:hypothetical protein
MKIIVKASLVMLLLVVTAWSAEAQWPLGNSPQPQLKPPEPDSNLAGTGRFQVFISPNIKGHTFMLDSNTGKMWVFKKDHSTGDFYLERVKVENVDTGKSDDEKTEEPNNE